MDKEVVFLWLCPRRNALLDGGGSGTSLSAPLMQGMWTRVQSADLTRAADKTAPRVTIIHHPDVRRSLMLNKAYAEGLRALTDLGGASTPEVLLSSRDLLVLEAMRARGTDADFWESAGRKNYRKKNIK